MTPKRAIAYTRISDDKMETGKGVARQEEDIRKLAAHLDWTILEPVLVENDTSAFKRRKVKLPDGTTAYRVVREKWSAALELLASGAGDGFLVYDLDRAVRDPRDFEDLADVVELRGIAVESVTGSLKMGNDTEIMMSRNMVNYANKSSRDTARRVKRKHEELRAEGKPGGGGVRPYGFTIRMEVIPDEAEIVKEVAERVISGESFTNIAKDLNKRNVPTVKGAPWRDQSVKNIVAKPSVAGLRSKTNQETRTEEIIGPAVWDAILDRETWESVIASLESRDKGGPNQLTHWLVGLLYCSKCGKGLVSWSSTTGKRYWCATPRGGCGGIAVQTVKAEEEVERQMLEYLTDPDVLTRLQSAEMAPEAVTAVRAALADAEEREKQLAVLLASGQMSLPAWNAAQKVVQQEIHSNRQVLSGMAPRALRRLLAVEDIVSGWNSLLPPEKREITLAVIPKGYNVMPATPRYGFDPERLRLAEDEDTVAA
jgi:site-specific DNA recombinase